MVDGPLRQTQDMGESGSGTPDGLGECPGRRAPEMVADSPAVALSPEELTLRGARMVLDLFVEWFGGQTVTHPAIIKVLREQFPGEPTRRHNLMGRAAIASLRTFPGAGIRLVSSAKPPGWKLEGTRRPAEELRAALYDHLSSSLPNPSSARSVPMPAPSSWRGKTVQRDKTVPKADIAVAAVASVEESVAPSNPIDKAVNEALTKIRNSRHTTPQAIYKAVLKGYPSIPMEAFWQGFYLAVAAAGDIETVKITRGGAVTRVYLLREPGVN